MAKRGREDSISGSEERQPSTVSLSDGLLSPPLTDIAHAPKFVHLEEDILASPTMECKLPLHTPIQFSSHEEYEVHYRKEHANRCSECHKNFPTGHYLKLHQAENHDPINEARRDRGENIYACFLEDCDRIFKTWFKRKLHSIDKHGFPKNYDFFIVNDGLDHRNSMLRQNYRQGRRGGRFRGGANNQRSPRDDTTDTAKSDLPDDGDLDQLNPRTRIAYGQQTRGVPRFQIQKSVFSTSTPHTQPFTEQNQSKPDQLDSEMDDITRSMSVLRFVPRSVMFNRSKAKASQFGSG